MKKLILFVLLLMPVASHGFFTVGEVKNLLEANEDTPKYYLTTVVNTVYILDITNMLTGSIRTICIAHSPVYLSNDQMFNLSRNIWNDMITTMTNNSTPKQLEAFNKSDASLAIINYMKIIFPCGKNA